MKPIVNIMWFRRDLRLKDNAALYHSLTSEYPVVPIFILDKNILDDLDDKKDRRVAFIHDALLVIQHELISIGSSLEVYYGFPEEIFKTLLNKYDLKEVFTNHDYEQYAIDRDETVKSLLHQYKISFNTYKDHVIFEKDEVVKDDGRPYTVFTPYSKKWKLKLNDFFSSAYPAEKYCSNFYRQDKVEIPSLDAIGFQSVDHSFPARELPEKIVSAYDKQRDFPAIEGTSRVSVHLRFGTISIRQVVRQAKALNETFLNELIWRDFYHMILWRMPHVRSGLACKPEYDRIEWRNNEKEFDAWCNGETGYPIVDAGMRELNTTGFMHNRVRMITASFLCKHLLIDWRWGETYFAQKLLDYDFAANNGGWQWTAGSGCDAAPYFRIFSPKAQTEKFDRNLQYIRKWIPELDSVEYPKPIVDHEFARKRCLEVYAKALKVY
jgi:deoxyribodipyrimidine photo-lyase